MRAPLCVSAAYLYARTSECDGTHGCVYRAAFYFCYRVAAKGGIQITSGRYDRRSSIVCELDFGHVTGPLKTLSYQIPGKGNVAQTNPGFMSGENLKCWEWREREIWKSPHCYAMRLFVHG